jgi:hypothetical protein
MDGRGVVALYEVDVVAIAAQDGFDGVVGRSAEHRRARDLVPVEMEDGEHRAVAHGVEKVDPLPRSHSGPVSASPSPTTHATTRSGLSNAAPNACTRA